MGFALGHSPTMGSQHVASMSQGRSESRETASRLNQYEWNERRLNDTIEICVLLRSALPQSDFRRLREELSLTNLLICLALRAVLPRVSQLNNLPWLTFPKATIAPQRLFRAVAAQTCSSRNRVLTPKINAAPSLTDL